MLAYQIITQNCPLILPTSLLFYAKRLKPNHPLEANFVLNMVNPYKIKNAGKENNEKIIRQLRCILQHDHYVLKYFLSNFLKNIMLSRSH